MNDVDPVRTWIVATISGTFPVRLRDLLDELSSFVDRHRFGGSQQGKRKTPYGSQDRVSLCVQYVIQQRDRLTEFQDL